MALRLQRSISLGHGVRLNISRRGLGISIGRPGLRVGINTSGRRTVSVGIPGTGIAYRSVKGGRRAPPHLEGPRPIACALGYMFGRRPRRQLIRGLLALYSADPMSAARALDHLEPAARYFPGAAFYAGVLDSPDAMAHLRRAIAAGIPDETLLHYVDGPVAHVQVTPEVNMRMPVGTEAASLALARLLSTSDRIAEAIEVLVPIEPKSLAVVTMLADLCVRAGAFARAIDVTAGLTNKDDLSVQALTVRARALAELGEYDTALAVLTTALSTKKRDLTVLSAARELRVSIWEAMDEGTKARKDLALIRAAVGRGEDVHPVPEPAPPAALSQQATPGMLLREARRRAGLTQRELAHRAGVAHATVAGIENGGSRPRRQTFEKLLRACGVEP